MSRIKLLLEKGYFPSQLPPSFSTADFSAKSVSIRKAWKGLVEPQALKEGPQLEPFSVARAGHSRRNTSLVNPVTQFRLADFISDHWKTIDKLVKRSKFSLSRPDLKSGANRAISLAAPKLLAEQRLFMSPGYKYALVTDISQFFPTLYTHSIPWAAYGKPKAKANRHKLTMFANRLDSLVQRCQYRQTLGIPIGPDTSHIIAEILASSIDQVINRGLPKPFAGYRYVDDFVLFFRSLEHASSALAVVESALREYELKINTFKTKIVPITQLVEDSWTHSLRSFVFSHARNTQKRDLNHFFDLTFSTAFLNTDENVLKFALRKLSGTVIKQSNWTVLQSHLCRAVTSFPNCLQEAAHLLTTYRHYGYPLDDGVGRTLNLIIEEHAPLEHHSEVAWALWLCRQFGIRVTRAATAHLKTMKSSATLLLAFDLQSMGLLEGRIDKRSTRRFATSESLYESSWLLSYEGGIRNWIFKGSAHVAKDPFFSALQLLDVHFYVPSIGLAPLFSTKAGTPPNPAWFDEDKDIDAHFKFSDVDIEYQNLPIDEGDDEEGEDPLEAPAGLEDLL